MVVVVEESGLWEDRVPALPTFIASVHTHTASLTGQQIVKNS